MRKQIPPEEEESARPTKLNKFTSWKRVRQLLESEKLILGDPREWEDENDRAVLEHYARQKRSGEDKPRYAVRASCFQSERETVYHWKAFTEKEEDACCVEFKAEAFVKMLEDYKKQLMAIGQDLLFGKVRYRPMWQEEKRGHDEILCREDEKKIELEKLPFYKRWPFRCEGEYRVIWGGDRHAIKDGIVLNLNGLIHKINLSPKLQAYQVKDIRDSMKEWRGKIFPSTLNYSPRWIECIEKVGLKNSQQS